MIDVGRGEAVVLVPGLQGRWEWMAPAVDALARHHRVISFSLCDEPTSGFPCDPSLGFENYVTQVRQALDRAGLNTATLVGVSYGGLIASEAAARMPGRVNGLVLASALPTDWHPDARARFYLRAPRLLSPLFVLGSPGRLQPEVSAAFPAVGRRLRFMARHGWRVLTAPMSPVRMARRIRWSDGYTFTDSARVQVPVLLVTGEPGLDRIVPVDVSRRALERMPHARHEVLSHTGHIGLITRPEPFADAIGAFVERCAAGATPPQMTGSGW